MGLAAGGGVVLRGEGVVLVAAGGGGVVLVMAEVGVAGGGTGVNVGECELAMGSGDRMPESSEVTEARENLFSSG